MFSPHGFLTSVLQAHAREKALPLETLKLQHCVKSAFGTPADVVDIPTRGVFVYGIYVEGGRWDVHSQQLEDCRPGTLYSPMPVIHFAPITNKDLIATKLSTGWVDPDQQDGLPQGSLSVSARIKKGSAFELNPDEMG